MKALAKKKEDRYQNVDAFRQDLERFVEGRSVSAKHDTVREAAWKLVKRNKGVSAVAAAAMIVIGIIAGWSAWTNYQERRAKFEYARTLVPAYVRAAEVSANDQRLDDALGQLAFALEYEPEYPEGLMLRAKVHIARQEFDLGAADLQRYFQNRKDDASARRLAELCAKANADDATTLAPFVLVFLQNRELGLAKAMNQAPEQILAFYRKKIEAAWPGRGKRLTMDGNGKLHLNLGGCTEVTDLSPLEGMPLTRLTLGNSSGGVKVKDLRPLTGMPLTSLNLSRCGHISDLTPLQGMPLTKLGLSLCVRVHDLTALRGLKLERVSFDRGAMGRITRGMEVLRAMDSLKDIRVEHRGTRSFSRTDFFERYDAGEFDE